MGLGPFGSGVLFMGRRLEKWQRSTDRLAQFFNATLFNLVAVD
jgi:hypothetical protein